MSSYSCNKSLVYSFFLVVYVNFSSFTAMSACASTKDQLESVSDNLCINFVTNRADFFPCHQRADVCTLWAKTHRTGMWNSKFCPCEFEVQPLAGDCGFPLPGSGCSSWGILQATFPVSCSCLAAGEQPPCAQQGAILIEKDRLARICLCHSKADETTAWNLQAGEASLKKVASWGGKKTTKTKNKQKHQTNKNHPKI